MVPVVRELERLGIDKGTILDYGSGTGGFAAEMTASFADRYTVAQYEPGIPEHAVLPRGQFDAVVCTHVLEHIEPLQLYSTVEEIAERATRLIYIEVPHAPAARLLPDGRNAHLIQRPPLWWRDILTSWLEPYGFEVTAQRPGANPINTVYIVER